LALVALDPGVIAPGGHLRHEGQSGGLQLGAAGRRRPPLLPGDHALEADLERLQLAALVDAVLAVAAGLDGHRAALAGVLVTHGRSSSSSAGNGWAGGGGAALRRRRRRGRASPRAAPRSAIRSSPPWPARAARATARRDP